MLRILILSLLVAATGAALFTCECRTDSDCTGRDERCVSGRCVNGAECLTDCECPLGKFCIAGFCGCRVDSDCPENWMYCSGGRCIDRCILMKCPVNCPCSKGVCVCDPCRNVQCFRGCTCYNGECICQDICEGVRCPPDQECVDGICRRLDIVPL